MTLFLSVILFSGFLNKTYADVTLNTSAVADGNVSQGSNNNVVYVVKVDAATDDVTVNKLQFTLTGTHDANDLTTLSIYFNPTAPTIAGSTGGSNVSAATFAAPHTYNVGVSRTIAAGSSAYFIIAVNISSTATDNNTIKINGLTNPVVFGFTAAPNIVNNQSDIAGVQTIQAADVTLTSSTIAASNVAQGSTNNVLYAVKMDAATEDVTVNNLQFTLTGTHDANDLTTLSIYFNPTSPTIAGSTGGSNVSAATFAAPHTYNVGVSRTIAAGSSAYFIISININSTATGSNTIQINGATNPIVFGFTAAPNIVNNQSDIAGIKTIQGVLPVSLISFSAKNIQNKVQLSWATASEFNNAFFEIERTSDGSDFEKLAKIDGNGTSALTHNYNYVDELPNYGINYYRLKQTDIDGYSTYSEVVKINIDKGFQGFSVYPNPVVKNSKLALALSNLKKGSYTLSLINQQGKLMMKKIIEHAGGSSVETIALPTIAAGMYSIQLKSYDVQFIKNIVVE